MRKYCLALTIIFTAMTPLMAQHGGHRGAQSASIQEISNSPSDPKVSKFKSETTNVESGAGKSDAMNPHAGHMSNQPASIQQISKFLSDPEVSKFKFETINFELGPGKSDTISHRHDCDAFVIVLQGTLEIAQEFKAPVTVRTGEIFHEERNVIHSLTRNPDSNNPMKLLVVFIRKDGRQGYIPLYPKK
jgi:quercetin dioxygenase-like cupin family protein